MLNPPLVFIFQSFMGANRIVHRDIFSKVGIFISLHLGLVRASSLLHTDAPPSTRFNFLGYGSSEMGSLNRKLGVG